MRLQEPLLVGGELFLRVVHGGPSDATRPPVGLGPALHYTRRDPARGGERWQTDSPRELEVLLADEQTFDPPPEFTAQANASDPADLRGGRERPRGLVGELGQEARLGRAVERGARLEPAVGQVVRGREAERLAQLPGPPRRRRRSASASPSTGRARTASAATITYAELLDMTQRFANVLKDLGRGARRPRRDLHADDPGGARRDARLRADRRAAFRRLRRLLPRGGQGPHQRLRGEGAGHGRLLAAPRQADPDEGGGGRRARRVPVDRARRGRAPHRRRHPVDRGPRRLVARGGRRPPRPTARPSRSTPSRCCSCSTPPARPRSRRASCTRAAAT